MKILLQLNKGLLVLPVLIFSCSLVTVLSVYSTGYISHISSFIISFFFYFLFVYVDFDIQLSIWKIWYFLSIISLAFLHFFATPVFGASRWIDLGFINFQPSEMAKIALLLLSAFYLSKPDFIKFKNILLYLVYALPLVILTFLQPDLGTTLVMLFGMFIMLFFSNFPKIVFVVFFSLLGLVSNPLWNSLHDYQKDRILVLVNPEIDSSGKSYNVKQALIAVGSGGFWGKGFGSGTQAVLRFLPSFWTDFIFASFAEEWGFFGSLVLLILYLFLLLCLIYIISVVKEERYRVFAIGVFGVFVFQFFVNIGMNLGLVPVTGITLPLMSYGGTSNVVIMSLFGMLQSIWLRSKS